MFTFRSKLQSLCLAACLAAATTGGAALVNFYDAAQLVPYANFTSGGNLTAVGLLARKSGTLYWAFFDGNGNRRANSSFPIEANELHPFFWNPITAGDNTLEGQPGFLLFALDTNGDAQITDADWPVPLGANAFYIAPPDDVAYIPTLNVDYSWLASSSPVSWNDQPVMDVLSVYTGVTVDIQYYIDGAHGGDDTAIVIWSPRRMASPQNMTLHNGDRISKPIGVELPNENLNLIDLETNAEVTSGFFGDGYLRWNVPNASDDDQVTLFLFSMVSSPAFGAIQTLLPNAY